MMRSVYCAPQPNIEEVQEFRVRYGVIVRRTSEYDVGGVVRQRVFGGRPLPDVNITGCRVLSLRYVS